MRSTITRRDSILRCAALGGLNLVPALTLAEARATVETQKTQALKATPWNEIGPYYKRGAPNNPQLRAPGDPGLPVTVTGRVFDTRGQRIQGASVEVWHTDHLGLYDLDSYRYRASLLTDEAGVYSFHSTMPGHYPARVCQHIHYIVSAPGCKPLVTQLYFATDPVFEGDPDRNYMRDPLVLSRELVRPVTLSGDPSEIHGNVRFEIVLEPL